MNLSLEIARRGETIRPVHVQRAAFDLLWDMLGCTPVSRRTLLDSRHTEGPLCRVEAFVSLPPGWQYHAIDEFTGAIRGAMARIVRTLKAAVRSGGEIAMVKWDSSAQAGYNFEAICDERQGIYMRLDYREPPGAPTLMVFTVLYSVRETQERSREEWFRDLHAYSLTEA